MQESTVLLGDAIEVMQQHTDASVSCIITDPPYGVGYHSNYYKERNPHMPITGDWDFAIAPFLEECVRILTDGGALYLFCRWDVAPLWIPAIQPTGLKLKTVIAWVKDNWSAGDLTGSFGNQYELILFVTKGRHILRGKRWSNVWNFPRVPAQRLLHPAQKPTPLLERAILASTDEGDLVLDPYAGSGSTGEACLHTHRAFCLCDTDKKMITVTRKRLGFPQDGSCAPEVPSAPPRYEVYTPSWDELGVHPEQIAEVYHLLHVNAHKE